MENTLKQKNGFTLIEILVVISIIGFISSVLFASFSTARMNARETRRKSDLQEMKTVLELYFDSHGNYPIGCWLYFEATGTNYIPNLAPEFVNNLPRDPLSGSSCPGGIGDGSNLRTYYYCSNGISYKLNVCSESPVPENSIWYDQSRPGYVYMACNGEPACSSF